MTVHSNRDYARGDRRRLADPRVALLKELADPIRLRVIDRLTNSGPATVTRLAEELGVALPQLSNHLRRLRNAKLVSAQRSGRQVTYELADPGLELLPPLLDSITGRVHAPAGSVAPGVPSRTCYSHLGGEIGVGIYRALVERGALVARPDGIVELGRRGAEDLAALGVAVADVDPGRRRFAYECLDATQRAPHLAGALGDALARALTARGWIDNSGDGRVYGLTASGKRGLKRTLGLSGTTGSRSARRR
jgi:DNA-binding transcriptional ArsR family regulator